MKLILNANLISGGNPAIAAGVAVITGVAALSQSIDYYIDKGEKIGERIYNAKHPDDGLGKMVYTKDDFKQPNWYAPPNTHPNNFNSDNFHNSFGGF